MTSTFNAESLARLYSAPSAIHTPTQSEVRTLSATDRKLFRGTAVQIHDGMTTDEVLNACNANFSVEVTASYHPWQDGFKPSKRHTVWHRSDTGEALGVFGNRRTATQPRDFIEYFRTFTQQSGERIQLDVVGSLDGGRTFYMGAKLTENNVEKILNDPAAKGTEFGVSKLFNAQDRSDYWLIITDHYGEAKAPKATLLCNRLVCANGMTRRIDSRLVGLSHRRTMTETDVMNVLRAGLAEARGYAAVQQLLQETAVTPAQFQNSIRAFYRQDSEQKLSATVRNIESIYQHRLIGSQLDTMTTSNGEPNAWRALNALTQHTSRSSSNPDSAFRSQLSGTRGSYPQQYLKQLANAHGNAELRELVAA